MLTLLIASVLSSSVKLSGWVVFDDDGSSLKSYLSHANVLQSASFDWIHSNSAGEVKRQPHPTADERSQILMTAKKYGVKVYALAANDGFQAEGVETVLSTLAAMRTHADALTKIAVEDGVDGIDLDYESLKAKDREAFSKFVQVLADSLHAKKLSLVLAVHAKTAEPGDWDGSQAQDWVALGKLADSIRVMTYDDHWDTSEAGPISPPDWVDQVMAFAAKEIPPVKLEMGIAGYGYDWLGKKGSGITWTQWTQLLSANGSAKRDPASQELVLTYKNRTVFFVDGEAARPKFGIAKRLGLNGMALWRLGSEDPSFWKVYGQQSRK